MDRDRGRKTFTRPFLRGKKDTETQAGVLHDAQTILPKKVRHLKGPQRTIESFRGQISMRSVSPNSQKGQVQVGGTQIVPGRKCTIRRKRFRQGILGGTQTSQIVAIDRGSRSEKDHSNSAAGGVPEGSVSKKRPQTKRCRNRKSNLVCSWKPLYAWISSPKKKKIGRKEKGAGEPGVRTKDYGFTRKCLRWAAHKAAEMGPATQAMIHRSNKQIPIEQQPTCRCHAKGEEDLS